MSEQKDRYMGLLLDGASPFNGRPSTHFRQAILGIMKEPFCFSPDDIETPDDIEKTSSIAIQPRIPFECPEEKEHTVRTKVGVPFELERDIVKGYKLVSVAFETENAEDFIREGKKFAATKEGDFEVRITEMYEDNLTCEHVYQVKVSAAPKTDEDDDDE